MAESENIVLDYTSRDFDTIRSLLVGIARGTFPEWRTVGEANDFGTLLLELYAYMGDVSHFYIDRVASEAFLGTAIRRESVLYIAEMLGYQPINQLAAIVELTFSLSPTYQLPSDVTELVIPAGTRVETSERDAPGDNPISFETDYAVTIVPGGRVTVSATEGRTVKDVLIGASKGAPNASFSLPDTGIISRSVSVQTLEGRSSATSPQYVKWFETPTVVSGRPNQSVFTTWSDDKGTTYILFGDNASGRIPPIGAEISVSYRTGVGGKANSLGSNALTVIADSALPTEALTVTNIDTPFGGADPESIESMRFSIPRASRVRDRAVTLEDFVSLTVQVPGVAKAMAYGEVYSSVNIRIAPVGGEVTDTLMAEIKRDVVEYLEDKVLIGSKVFIEDVQWQDVFITLDLHVLDGFSRDLVESQAVTAITNLFAFDNLDFGQRVTVGQVYRAVTQIDGVDWLDITSMNYEGGTSVVINTEPGKDRILRIHPGTEPFDSDPYGLSLTTTGGVV
jgi:hypothetical protein